MAQKKKKSCPIEAAGIKHIDYKDTDFLRSYLTKFNRIVPRYYSGVSLENQKKLATAIKRARYMALLPYVLEIGRPTPSSQLTHEEGSVSMRSELDESAVAV